MAPSCGTRHGVKQWINLEPCGLFCGTITWFLLGYGMYGMSFAVILPWLGLSWFGITNLILFNSISIVAIYAHIKTMTTDPGAVPRSARPLLEDTEERDYEQSDSRTEQFKKFCRKCRAFKPKRAHHCSICGRCIVKMDHHCPWVNNCVGLGNHKLFLLFVFWVLVACVYSLVLILAKYISCSMGYHECSEPVNQLLVVFLVIEGLLFGLFTTCMLGDQMSSIYSNQTQIDRLKNAKYEHQSEINEVFGSHTQVNIQLVWLLPIPVSFKDPEVRGHIYGFRCEEGEEMSPLLAAVPATPAPVARNRKSLKTGEAHKEGDLVSEDTYEDSDTISEWLEDAASVASTEPSGAEDVEMAPLHVVNHNSSSSGSVFHRIKNDSPEGDVGKRADLTNGTQQISPEIVREKKK